ncbi:hypothetical protein SAMN05660909_04978 [Chitinophaga terrae (ex Kim and Jung 2007)]|uniref:Uncharacterized protein n=1 Tax=Chitinophaga terrae (ex Kim and Jung 2007) TaxID=408074 RepID=A0A1H4G613_9BACT|nr:hypothetical protein [Chitinophaga terrae (ex Kim and Jung 2007)]MDQ0105628.1 hypothetical protein [Chitinophaga terrae (ex Kim and Jung 2007)]GEP93106.1 hypothetical protein CTE07_47510 [Chitinophaga terrae (ex Kim and Jung 2007)]SEB05056.1 hypothetical protein SAMN05660909_04978 [Chitinophaga terrae (ex Kim and Jung 2007)]
MSVPYTIHEGARLRRILRRKEVVILQYAKKVSMSPQGLYRYFWQANIKKSKLAALLAAVPVSQEEFYHWSSIEGAPCHQGELLLLHLAKLGMKIERFAESLQLSPSQLFEWVDAPVFSALQLEKLSGLFPDLSFLETPQLFSQEINWREAYLDVCEANHQHIRKIATLEQKIMDLESIVSK